MALPVFSTMSHMHICISLLIISHNQLQTDEHIEEDIQLYEDDSLELVEFMKKVGPMVMKELQKNKRSHAFDGICQSSNDRVAVVRTRGVVGGWRGANS